MVAKTSPRFEREDDDAIPVVGWHKGVPLEDEQSDARLGLVRAEIDHVLGMSDAVALADWADDPVHSPESRQLAVAMAESLWTMAAENRNNRPAIDVDRATCLDGWFGMPALARPTALRFVA